MNIFFSREKEHSKARGEVNLSQVILVAAPLVPFCIVNVGLREDVFYVRAIWQMSFGLCFAGFLFFLIKRGNLFCLFGYQNSQVKLGIFTYLFAFPWMILAAGIGFYLSEEIFMFSSAPILTKTPSYFFQSVQNFETVLVAPLNEEIVFRGFMQSYLNRWGKPYLSILVVSLIFAFAHLRLIAGSINLDLVFSCFVSSLFLGYLFQKTGSLIASISFHISLNATAIFLRTAFQ